MKNQCDTNDWISFATPPVIFISASSCTAIARVFFLAFAKNINSINQGGIVSKIIARASFPLLHSSVQSVSLPFARRWYSLHTHNTKTPSSWLSYPMASTDQIKQMGVLLTEYHRVLMKSSTKPGKRRHLNVLLGCTESTPLPSNSLPGHIWLEKDKLHQSALSSQ